ncbi:hypothetical protein P3X46_010276 [Hevea brasiliensis]|uniref:Endonuclease/exonuclease/phosphatase domain-containing protein n=1 Tax=Hevea brasiliensis TaxID=3981 RepID=A0ABQ9MHL4_HEVBR|nr:hypothetical protein P3X46_010276 [Hevea brasiliensis]
MNLLSWNCQGVGNPLTVHNLKGLNAAHSPHFVFLMETKNKSQLVKKILNRCGFSDMVVVDPQGLAGGLAFAWNSDCTVSIVKMAGFFIHAKIYDANIEMKWNLIMVYISCVDDAMSEQFNFLCNYCNQMQDLLLIGDFNSFLRIDEKRGGNRQLDSKVFVFHGLSLIDLGFKGPTMTWNNHRNGAANIQERLDRGLASSQWLFHFPNAVIHHLCDIGSDYCPILLHLHPSIKKARRQFRFDSRWLGNAEVEHIISKA